MNNDLFEGYKWRSSECQCTDAYIWTCVKDLLSFYSGLTDLLCKKDVED